MKMTTFHNSKPKLSKEAINKKDTETKSTLNSGRSSTHTTNKRYSHELIYQTELPKNFNKSTILCLNSNPEPQMSNISHRVLQEKSGALHNNLKQENKGLKTNENRTNMKKVKQAFGKYPSKDKNKNVFFEGQNAERFHSHRESLVMSKGSVASHRVNSEEKENICSNLPSGAIHKHSQQDQKISLNKLSFILDKDFKEKNTLTKKKLPLSQEGLIKENVIHRLQEKSTIVQKQKEDQTRSHSNSVKESKKSIGSGRSHSIEKKKSTLRYIKTKQSSSIPVSQPKQYLKLKSPSDLPQNEAIKQEKTYSIKSLLKVLIDSSSDKKKDQEKNIRKIIDCLTTNDNQPFEDEKIGKGNVEKKNDQEKGNSKPPQQTPLIPLIPQSSMRIERKINGFELGLQPSINKNVHKQSIQHKHLIKTIKRYELKIMQLYEELIDEKEKRYQLQDMIEKYIIRREQQQYSS